MNLCVDLNDFRYQLAGDDADAAFLRRTHWRSGPSGWPAVSVVDLFCGAGGLSLGAREACARNRRLFDVRLAVDLDPDALAVYSQSFAPRRAENSDLARLVDGDLGTPPTAIEAALVVDLGRIDLFLAGPPCQGHSSLNNHTRHEDDRNLLYLRAARFVELVQPEHVIIENVPTVTVAHERPLQRTVQLLMARGYHVDSATVDVSTIGVPQRRRRHVLAASREKKIVIGNVVEANRADRPRSIAWAIRDLLEHKPASADDVYNSAAALSPQNQQRARFLHDHGLFDLPDAQRPPCHRGGGHKYKSMYGRLSWDEPARTITGGFGSPGQGRFFHPEKPRTLTPHEAARLQFFPDFHDFSAVRRRKKLAKLIGNAVPPKLADVLVAELLR